jgi:hypothetical protein
MEIVLAASASFVDRRWMIYNIVFIFFGPVTLLDNLVIGHDLFGLVWCMNRTSASGWLMVFSAAVTTRGGIRRR